MMESERRLAMTTDAAVCLRVCVCVCVGHRRQRRTIRVLIHVETGATERRNGESAPPPPPFFFSGRRKAKGSTNANRRTSEKKAYTCLKTRAKGIDNTEQPPAGINKEGLALSVCVCVAVSLTRAYGCSPSFVLRRVTEIAARLLSLSPYALCSIAKFWRLLPSSHQAAAGTLFFFKRRLSFCFLVRLKRRKKGVNGGARVSHPGCRSPCVFSYGSRLEGLPLRCSVWRAFHVLVQPSLR